MLTARIFILCFCILYIPEVISAGTALPMAQKGFIDLKIVNFSESTLIPLEGEWHYSPAEFLSPQKMPMSTSYKNVPGKWLNADTHTNPANLSGYATYSLRITLPENENLAYSLSIPDLLQPYSLFWNGKSLPTPGIPAKISQDSYPQSMPAVYYLPNVLKGDNLIVVHISNFHAPSGGFIKPPLLGLSAGLHKHHKMLFAYEAFTAGFIFLFMIHLLIIYFLRPYEPLYLYLSLCFMLSALYIVNSGEKIMPYFLTWLDIRFHTPLRLLSGIWAGYFFLKFIGTLFTNKILRIVTLFTMICAIMYTLLIVILPLNIFLEVFSGYATFLNVFLSMAIFLSVLFSRISGLSERILLLTGTAIIIISLLVDRYYVPNNGIRTLPLGLLLFFLMHIISLSVRFTTAFRQTENFKIELDNYTRNLQKMVEERTIDLKQARRQAEDSNNLKDKFIGIISHDLRSPLSGIEGLLKIMAEPDEHMTEKEKKEVIQVAALTVGEVLRMTEDLLTLNRFSSGKIQAVLVDFDLHVLVNSIFQKASGQAFLKSVQLINIIPEQFIIKADPLLLEQVILNLITNSIKFSRHKGMVVVFAEREGTNYFLRVKDTGMGIPAEIIPDLFNPSIKTVRSGTGGEKGSGLGLVICREIMKAHNGDITAESSTAKGTLFTLVLPIHHSI